MLFPTNPYEVITAMDLKDHARGSVSDDMAEDRTRAIARETIRRPNISRKNNQTEHMLPIG